MGKLVHGGVFCLGNGIQIKTKTSVVLKPLFKSIIYIPFFAVRLAGQSPYLVNKKPRLNAVAFTGCKQKKRNA